MAIESAEIIRLDPVLEMDRENLLNEMSAIMDPDRLESLQEELLTLEDDIYVVKDPLTSETLGCVCYKEYDRIEHAREIIPWLREPLCEAVHYGEVLRESISILQRARPVNQVVLKIEETRTGLIKSAEALGFTKEGIFISNRFLKGEFSFYFVYSYRIR